MAPATFRGKRKADKKLCEKTLENILQKQIHALQEENYFVLFRFEYPGLFSIFKDWYDFVSQLQNYGLLREN